MQRKGNRGKFHGVLGTVFFLFLWQEFSLPMMLPAAQPSAAPLVPAFERFFARTPSASPVAGRLLLSELNCVACHLPDEGLTKQWPPKQAPLLDGIAERANLSYLRKFLMNPQAVKPGTTMPQIFAGFSPAERKERVEALVHFLATTGTFRPTPPDTAAAAEGERLFHTLGCAACHGSRRQGAKNPSFVVPLGSLAEKYSVNSLSAFLRNPLKVRPAGRMPHLNLSPREANALASWFLKDVQVPTNLTYRYYEGRWPQLPDFSRLKPKRTGGATGFDLRLAGRKNNYALRFTGFLQVRRKGRYTFFVGSDDGAKLYLDGRLVVNNDGEHPFSVKSRKVMLSPGPHSLVLEFAQVGGGAELRVEYQGPGMARRPVAGDVTATKEPPKPEPAFRIDPALVEKGRRLFTSSGCASCHLLHEKGQRLTTQLAAKPLSQLPLQPLLQTDGAPLSCVGKMPQKGTPFFALSASQRKALSAALQKRDGNKKPAGSKGASSEAAQAVIHRTMLQLNCYACHGRHKIGGPVDELDAVFVTTTREMGDEGRLPPPLDGVGDKLTDEWLKHVLSNGADDRPYMLTRMPKFGAANTGHLVAAFAQADRKTLAKIPQVDIKPRYLKAAGRHLVGEKAFACIKCHTFGKFRATGIQSLDLTQFHRRIRQDWFFRYMMKPIRYRPGTRMPTPFPGGISTLPDVLDGQPATQLLAIWTYLADGNKARVPLGLIRGKLPLKPQTEPILYRNFIAGLSPRGIAVGYPGGLNLAFDADRLVLALLWHGEFIDAGRHWQGRGQGFQPPLGDHVVSLPRDVPFAVLDRIDAVWPKESARHSGYRFLGYRLNDKRQPIFQYRFGSVQVEDFPQPVPGEIDPSLKRTLVLKFEGSDQPPALLYLAATASQSIRPLKDGWYQIDDGMRIRISQEPSVKPVVRKSGTRYELLVPVTFRNKTAVLIHEYVW